MKKFVSRKMDGTGTGRSDGPDGYNVKDSFNRLKESVFF